MNFFVWLGLACLVLKVLDMAGQWAVRRMHVELSNRNGCDQKCPFCHTWQGARGGWSDIETVELGEYRLKCGNCERWSRWSFNAPVAICLEGPHAGR